MEVAADKLSVNEGMADRCHHGCSHLEAAAEEEATLQQLLKRYSAGLRWGKKVRDGEVQTDDGEAPDSTSERPGKRRKLLPHPTCGTCSIAMQRPFICLVCAWTGCFAGPHTTQSSDCHVRSHLRTHSGTSPALAVDLHSGMIFCGECDDVVYDSSFEEVQRNENRRAPLAKASSLSNGQSHLNENGEAEDIKPVIDQPLAPSTCRVPRGLRNLGATCFMNVILQSFIHNPLLRNFFLSDRHSSRICAWRDNCLACELDLLFEEFFSPDKQGDTDLAKRAAPYGPTTFLFCMWLARESAELTSAGQHDAHELFISALNGVHSALVSADRRVRRDIVPSWPFQKGLPRSTSRNGHKDKDELCDCAVHRTFAGILQSDVTCERCDMSSSTEDPVLDLSLDIRSSTARASSSLSTLVTPSSLDDLSEKSKKKQQKKKEKEEKERKEREKKEKDRDGAEEEEQDLVECLRRYCSPEQLDASGYTCANCAKPSPATKQLSLSRLPPVLCIQLKRFEHNSSATKIETRIRFPRQLDLREFCTPHVRQARLDGRALQDLRCVPGMSPDPDAYVYDLFTVVVHEGSMNTGHYRNFSKCRGAWYHFDDDQVNQCSLDDVLGVKAYQLCYVRRELRNVRPEAAGGGKAGGSASSSEGAAVTAENQTLQTATDGGDGTAAAAPT